MMRSQNVSWRMMIATILVASCPALALAQDPMPTDARADGLVGRVHTVSGERFSARRTDGRIVEEGRHRPIEGSSYDASGRVELRELIDDSGSQAGRQTYRYENGRLFEMVVRDTQGSLLERRLPRYGAAAAPETLTVDDDSGEGYVEKYVRGARGRIEAIIYLVANEEMGRSLFSYGAGPEPIEVAFVTADGEPATAPVGPCAGGHRVVTRYDGSQIAERTLYRADGSLKQRSVFGYDQSGNVVSELRSTSFDMDRLTHTYEFDAAGNWIKRVSALEYDVKAGEPPRANALLSVTLRVLTYY